MGFLSNLLGQKKYPEEWSFYMTNIENKPASVYLNLGLYKLIPIKEKSSLCWISVKLNDKTENELTTNDESKILFEIEDKILEKINSNNSLYVGRITNMDLEIFSFIQKILKYSSQRLIKLKMNILIISSK